jgi:hypothetical protein
MLPAKAIPRKAAASEERRDTERRGEITLL